MMDKKGKPLVFASPEGFHSTNLGFDEPGVNIKIIVNQITEKK
jgi:hypothetical protein